MGKIGNTEHIKPTICYIINDKIGGITSLNMALASAIPSNSSFKQHFAFYSYKENKDSRYNKLIPEADSQTMLEYSKRDNIYYVFKKFGKQLPAGNGLIVSNDIFELHYIESFGTDKTVFQIVHDDYNLELSVKFEPIIDVYIAHSLYIYNKLVRELPERKDACFYLPYGIEIPTIQTKEIKLAPLNLMFLGRITESKGVFELLIIDNILKSKGIDVNWTVIGRGPDKTKLIEQWTKTNPNVLFISPETKDELNDILKHQDIFVFPTKFEGFPVALLETMAFGVVPVVSDIPSGIPELVNTDNGYIVPLDDAKEFAAKITILNENRSLLQEKSNNAMKFVHSKFELKQNMTAYHELFKRYSELKTIKPNINRKIFGSRLDKFWIPNFVVRIIRRFIY